MFIFFFGGGGGPGGNRLVNSSESLILDPNDSFCQFSLF